MIVLKMIESIIYQSSNHCHEMQVLKMRQTPTEKAGSEKLDA